MSQENTVCLFNKIAGLSEIFKNIFLLQNTSGDCVWMCPIKKLLRKISQNLLGKTCDEILFVMKLLRPSVCNFAKKRLHHKCRSLNFAKLFRIYVNGCYVYISMYVIRRNRYGQGSLKTENLYKFVHLIREIRCCQRCVLVASLL